MKHIVTICFVCLVSFPPLNECMEISIKFDSSAGHIKPPQTKKEKKSRKNLLLSEFHYEKPSNIPAASPEIPRNFIDFIIFHVMVFAF